MSDENGGVQIKFDAPTEDTGTRKASSEQETEKKPELSQLSGKTSSKVLETRKKRLEQQIKSCGDSEKATELKKKLAQVKRELSAAKG